MTSRHMICFFQVRGKGTRRMSELRSGDKVRVWGPLGNGFAVEPDTISNPAAGWRHGYSAFVGYERAPQALNISMLFGHREHISVIFGGQHQRACAARQPARGRIGRPG